MNKSEYKGTWKEQKSKLKQAFAALTGNDLLFEKGQKKEMIAKLQLTIGK